MQYRKSHRKRAPNRIRKKQRIPETGSYKINSYLIPKEVIKDMNELIKDAKETGKERGMALCVEKGSNVIKAGLKSTGSGSGIDVPETCRSKDDKYVGAFHTHLTGEATASAQDLFNSCLEITDLDCIGKNKQGRIVCYSKKEKGSSCVEDVHPLKNVEDMFPDMPPEKLPAVKHDLYKQVDDIARKKFNIHTIDQ